MSQFQCGGPSSQNPFPMAIQYFRGGYGRVELAPMMACIIIAIIPIIILYMTCQKYIIEGVVAGAVKG